MAVLFWMIDKYMKMKTNRKITALSVQKRNNQRVNVYLDDEFAFGLASIVAAWLRVGQELNPEKIAQLQAEDEREVAYQKALNFLGYRERSEVEVREYLEKGEFPEAIISQIVARLRTAGLLDDRRFAEHWVENRAEFRPRGLRALNFELKRKGLSQETIDAALQTLDEGDLAYKAAIKQSRKLSELEWVDFRKKMYAHLARRGFSYEVISPVVQRAWQEQHNKFPDDDLTKEVDV